MTAPPPPSALAALDQRSRDIFREIVEAYLESGDPVGSRTLSRRGALGLSPASIRNTMADLAQLGLLDSPHVMAGRRPTQTGLRFFVDSLLELGDPAEPDRAEIDQRLAGRSREEILSAASELLSGLAGGAGLVLTPRQEAAIRHAELVPLKPGQALAIFVFEDGTVENRILKTPPDLPQAALVEASNFLVRRFKGRTIAEARAAAAEELERERAALDQAAAKLVEGGLVEWTGENPGGGGRALIVRGRGNLLQDPEAAADLERVRRLFDDLEKSEELVQILDLAGEAESVRIFIGSENPLFSLSGSSLIVAPYSNPQRQVVGALGVIGPTRLNYARVIPVVNYTARLVGRLLDRG
jgi:heat-inducible transcriptional repressor